MDRQAIITKTAKGMREAWGVTRGLERDMLALLKEIDGKSAAVDLLARLDGWTAERLDEALARLLREGFVNELPPPTAAAQASPAGDLDFTSLPSPAEEEAARREAEAARHKAAEEKVRRRMEEEARREADKEAKRQAEEEAKRRAEDDARRRAEEEMQRQAEEKAKRQAEEEAKRQAEADAKRRAEEDARHRAEEEAQRRADEEAKRQAEEEAKRRAEEEAKRQAEEEAKHRAEEEARRQAEEEARRLAEERERQLEAERAAREAAEKARLEAEENARRAAEERARQETEEQARREAEELSKREAEEAARREAELAAELKAKQEAEAQAAREAERRAKQEAEKAARQARRHAEEKAQQQQARAAAWAAVMAALRRHAALWIALAGFGALLLAVGAVVLVHFLPFPGRAALFERAATERFGQPVKIGTAHVALLPSPHWRLEDVAVGDSRQLRVPRIDLFAAATSLFDDQPAFTAVAAEAPVVHGEALAWLAFGRLRGGAFGIASVDAHDATLEFADIKLSLPDVHADIDADGNWRTARVDAAFSETGSRLRIELQPGTGALQAKATTAQLPVPTEMLPSLADFSASGTIDREGFTATQFEGHAFGGSVGGSAHLRWSELRLGGELAIDRLAAGQMLAGLFGSGTLDGKLTFALPLHDASAAALDGRFSVDGGSLASIDLGGALKNVGLAGSTRFNRLDGSFATDAEGIHLRQLRMDAGAMTAAGQADVGRDGRLHGRLDVALNLAGERRRASLLVGGAFRAPYAKNIEWSRR